MAVRKVRWFLFGSVTTLLLCTVAFFVYWLFDSANHDLEYICEWNIDQCQARAKKLRKRLQRSSHESSAEVDVDAEESR